MNQEKANAIVLKDFNNEDEKYVACSYKCYKCDNEFWFAISEYDDMTTGDMHDCFIGSNVEGMMFEILYCIECRRRDFICKNPLNDEYHSSDSSDDDEWEYVCNNCEHLYLSK